MSEDKDALLRECATSLVDCVDVLNDLALLDWGDEGTPFNWDLITENAEALIERLEAAGLI